MNRLIRIGGFAFLLLGWMIGINLVLDLMQNRDPLLIYAQKSTEKMDEGVGQGLSPIEIAKGREIFEFTAGGVGCASCHSHFALGDIAIGPNIRGVTEDTIHSALENVELMSFLNGKVTDEDIHAVATYLQYLDTLTYAKTVRKNNAFDPTELTFPINTNAELIIENDDRTPCTFASLDWHLTEKVISGASADDFIFLTPGQPGSFTGSCKENPEATVTIKIEAPKKTGSDVP